MDSIGNNHCCSLLVTPIARFTTLQHIWYISTYVDLFLHLMQPPHGQSLQNNWFPPINLQSTHLFLTIILFRFKLFVLYFVLPHYKPFLLHYINWFLSIMMQIISSRFQTIYPISQQRLCFTIHLTSLPICLIQSSLILQIHCLFLEDFLHCNVSLILTMTVIWTSYSLPIWEHL